MWKSGRSSHCSGTSREFVRVIAAILSHVQFHINLLVPHCVKRCCIVSSAPQMLHRFVSERLITASRSLVGVRSWITVCATSTFGRPRSMLYGGWSTGVSNWHRDICGQYALSRSPLRYCVWLEGTRISGFAICAGVHSCKWVIYKPCPGHIGGRRRVCSVFYIYYGGFPLHRLVSTFVGRQLLRKSFVRLMSSFYQGGAPDISGLHRVAPIHLDLSAAGGSLWEHERWHLSI